MTRLISDRRGVAALEFSLIAFFFFALLIPGIDMAKAGFQYISGYQALRDLGIYLQYHTPSDFSATTLSSWQASLPKKSAGVTFNSTAVMCGTAICSSSNVASPKWFSTSTTITISPLFPAISNALLCKSSCTYTIYYTERFQ